MAPDQKTEKGNAQGGEGDEVIAKNSFARKARHQLTDNTHSRKNHDVDGGMRVEPEEVLVQQWIAAQRRIEDADVKESFDGDEHQGDGEHGRRQHENYAGGIDGPNEQRQTEPSQTRRAHFVYGDDEVESRKDRRKADDE